MKNFIALASLSFLLACGGEDDSTSKLPVQTSSSAPESKPKDEPKTPAPKATVVYGEFCGPNKSCSGDLECYVDQSLETGFCSEACSVETCGDDAVCAYGKCVADPRIDISGNYKGDIAIRAQSGTIYIWPSISIAQNGYDLTGTGVGLGGAGYYGQIKISGFVTGDVAFVTLAFEDEDYGIYQLVAELVSSANGKVTLRGRLTGTYANVQHAEFTQN